MGLLSEWIIIKKNLDFFKSGQCIKISNRKRKAKEKELRLVAYSGITDYGLRNAKAADLLVDKGWKRLEPTEHTRRVTFSVIGDAGSLTHTKNGIMAAWKF